MRRWLFWLKPASLPLAIGASVLLISWSYLMWNTTFGELFPVLRFRTKSTIAGILHQAAPILSLHSILTGEYQQWISRSIGELSPMFGLAIRWKNQIYYNWLGTTGTDSVVVGRNHQLFEMYFLEEYCSRDLAVLRTKGEDWAVRIRDMQDFFNKRGELFLYIITPSKIAQNPEIIPESYNCPAPAKDRADKLKVYDAILARHGVRFVDTASGLIAAREEYGISMFPRGGTHWNSLATALAAQKVIAAVNTQKGDPILSTLDFSWHVSYNPGPSDRDLLDLMNLPHPDTHYPVPHLTYQSTPTANGCHPITITEVGGSFLGGLDYTLEKLACVPEITNWFYWDHRRVHFAGGRLYELPMDADARRQSLLHADVIVLEENEAVAPASEHGERMMQEVATLARGLG